MKKSAIILLLLLAVPTLLTSCLFDEEELFDKSASERIEAAKQEAKTILESAENGWYVRYFPSPTQAFGGYNLFFRFSEGSVTIASEVESDPATTETSLYSFGEDLGVTLNFDTKNSLINYFVHPKNPDGLGSSHKGMEGDYKFTVMETSAEQVVLRGIMTGNYYILTPIPSGTDWAEDMKTYKEHIERMDFPSYECLVGDKVYQMALSEHNFTITLSAGNNLAAPFIYTKTGISFYEPLTIDNVTIQEMTSRQAKDQYNRNYYYFCNEDESIIIKPIFTDVRLTFGTPELVDANTIEVTVSASNTEPYGVLAIPTDYLEGLSDDQIGALVGRQYGMSTLTGNNKLRFESLGYETEYTLVGCGLNGRWAAATTPTVSTVAPATGTLPAASERYLSWLGKWTVTSTSSEKTGTAYSFDIIISPKTINSSYSISGWGLSTYGESYNITATLSAATLRLAGDQKIADLDDGSVIQLTNRYFNSDTGTGFGFLGSTNAANLAATQSSDGHATMTGRNGTLTSGLKFTVSCMELCRINGKSIYYPTPRKGYISQDFFIGPYTMVRTSPDFVNIMPVKPSSVTELQTQKKAVPATIASAAAKETVSTTLEDREAE